MTPEEIRNQMEKSQNYEETLGDSSSIDRAYYLPLLDIFEALLNQYGHLCSEIELNDMNNNFPLARGDWEYTDIHRRLTRNRELINNGEHFFPNAIRCMNRNIRLLLDKITIQSRQEAEESASFWNKIKFFFNKTKKSAYLNQRTPEILEEKLRNIP